MEIFYAINQIRKQIKKPLKSSAENGTIVKKWQLLQHNYFVYIFVQS